METALIICRFAQFSAAMLLFGSSSFAAFVAPMALAEALRNRFDRVNAWLVLLVMVTTITWLCLESGIIAGGWGGALDLATIEAVLTGTSFGTVWAVRLGLVVLPALALLLQGRRRTICLALASALVLGSLGFTGHAADDEGLLGLLHPLNHALHLMSSGFWLGCLPPLLATLALLRRPELEWDARQALSRFSGLGHVAVALALATGIANTALVLHHPPTDFSSPYQLLLAVKIGLVCLMLMVALFNRYVAVPHMAQAPWALRGIVAGTMFEIAIGVVVIALVSVFATMDPAGIN